MDRLIGVHGIGYKFCTREEILQEWAPALAGGIEWALDGRRPISAPDLDIAFYGRLFRAAPESSPGAGTSKGASTHSDAEEWADLDEDELDELAEAVREIVPAADLARAEAEPDKSLVYLPAPLAPLVGAVERTFPGAGRLVLRTVRQVRKYLLDPQLKQEVDRITADAAASSHVLIGHSLGSVVAYEFVRQHPDHEVSLLTIGSPLGLKVIRRRLPPGPPPARWINVRDRHDPVTAAGTLARWYPGVAEGWASNGSDAHAAKRYLSSKAVGKALVEFVPELAR
jgi:hypothetical protein